MANERFSLRAEKIEDEKTEEKDSMQFEEREGRKG
jgi:hypothetical protein